jgi:Cysteine-rich CPXCG
MRLPGDTMRKRHDAGDDPEVDEEFPVGDGTADGDAVITCPHCGESIEIALDAGSGARQEYVEDCEVCCRPWRVHVHYGNDGHADVRVDPLND